MCAEETLWMKKTVTELNRKLQNTEKEKKGEQEGPSPEISAYCGTSQWPK